MGTKENKSAKDLFHQGIKDARLSYSAISVRRAIPASLKSVFLFEAEPPFFQGLLNCGSLALPRVFSAADSPGFAQALF